MKHTIDVEAALRGYLTTALWVETDGDDALDEKYSVEDFVPASVKSAQARVEWFCTVNAADLEGMEAGQIGHDLWLTSRSHGAGFWDRGWGERGERLTSSAKALGEPDIEVGDDNRVYLIYPKACPSPSTPEPQG